MPVLTTIDKSASDAIKVSQQISLKKNFVLPDKNNETSIIAIKFDYENGQVSISTCVLPNYGYFNQQPSNFSYEKKMFIQKIQSFI